MKYPLFAILAAVTVSSTAALSLPQSQVNVCVSIVLSLSLFQHSTVSAFALPQNVWLEARHRKHNHTNADDNSGIIDGQQNASNGNRNNTTDANTTAGHDTPGRNRNNGTEDACKGRNSTSEAPSRDSQRNSTVASTSNGNPARVNGTSSSSGSGTGNGTLPQGFPPASPAAGFVAGQNKKSVIGLSRSAFARRGYQVIRMIGRAARVKIPVDSKRDMYSEGYDE